MDYYSSIAPGYEELYGEEQDGKLKEFLDRIEVDPRMVLLDVGCGTGRSAMMLECEWHGIEPSEGLIRCAHPRVRPRIRKGVAEDLPYPEGSFDIVISLTAIQNFSDARLGLQEMIRVLKPDGVLLLSFLRKSSRADQLDEAIRSACAIVDSWQQEKDMMYVCKRS